MIKNSNTEQENSYLSRESRAEDNTFSHVIDGFTISTIIIIFIAVAMLYLTSIALDMDMDIKDLSFEAAILYVFTIVINFLSRSLTKRKGRETKEHKEAVAKLQKQEDEIIQNGLRGREREYCRQWEENELRDARAKVLLSAKIEVGKFENEYLKFSGKELKAKKEELGITDYQLKIINKARRIKRLKYDERYLTTALKTGRRVSPTGEFNSVKYERWRTVKYLFTSLIGVLLSASITLDIISDPTFSTVVMCIIKIVTILVSAISGMIGGYKLTAEMETAELNRKAVEQKNFIIWCGKKEKDG